MVEIIGEGALASEINFDGSTRGPQNIVGFVALVRPSFVNSPYPELRNIHLLLTNPVSFPTSFHTVCPLCLGNSFVALCPSSFLQPVHLVASLPDLLHLCRHTHALPLLHDLVLRSPLDVPLPRRSIYSQNCAGLLGRTRGDLLI